MSNVDMVVRSAVKADVPVLIWGPPGAGKTASVQALAKQENAHLETLVLSMRDAADIYGLPIVDASRTRTNMAPADWVLRVRMALDSGRKVWVFLDEMSCASRSLQAAALRFVHERRAGDVDLTGCRMLAASNNAESAADGGTLAPATANRWAHVDYAPDVQKWVAGELSGWGKPVAEVAESAASVCAFIRRSPKALLDMPKDVEKASGAWPSPRAWSHAIRMMAYAGGPKSENAEVLVAANVGLAAASEWSTYQASMSLPDPELVLSGKAKVPTRGDEAHATLAAVVAAALSERPDREARVTSAWRIVGSVRPDVAIVPSKALRSGAPDIAPDEALQFGERIRAVLDAAQ